MAKRDASAPTDGGRTAGERGAGGRMASESRADWHATGAGHVHGRAAGPVRDSIPAKITLLYESRDRKLCLFEDAYGHLTAVRASKLA